MIPRDEISVGCPKCHGFARHLPLLVFEPQHPEAMYRRVWGCQRCNLWAAMDHDTHRPTEGMASAATHMARKLVAERLLESSLTPDEFRQEMALQPWNCKISHFSLQQCDQALKVFQAAKEDEDDEDLLT